MKVLIACEFSGIVRDAFAARGHDAWSCDLLPSERPGNHIQGDARNVLDKGWDLMVCHPPCTYLTCSAEWAYADGPYHMKLKPATLVGAARRAARAEAVEFCRLLLGAPVPRIALENPRGHLSSAIRKPDQTIQPHQFGEDASKATCLWLANLPPLAPTRHVEPRWVCCGRTLPDGVGRFGCPNCLGERRALPRWANQTDSNQNNLPQTDDRWALRSLTYQGIADAMADQWGTHKEGAK